MHVDERLLRLAPADNVFIATAALAAGDTVVVDGRDVVLQCDVPAGHKLAASDLPPGAGVVRYGMRIGSTTRAIDTGEWVHTHNLRSDYIETVEHRGGE